MVWKTFCQKLIPRESRDPMESRYQYIVPSQVVWTSHRHITPRLISSLIWVQESRSNDTSGSLLIGAAIACQCQKSSWNGWISSGQMTLQKDMSLTDWHVTNNITKFSFILDELNFCCSNHLEMKAVQKKDDMKKRIFCYNHEYPDNFKFLLQAKSSTKTLETLIQKNVRPYTIRWKKKS